MSKKTIVTNIKTIGIFSLTCYLFLVAIVIILYLFFREKIFILLLYGIPFSIIVSIAVFLIIVNKFKKDDFIYAASKEFDENFRLSAESEQHLLEEYEKAIFENNVKQKNMIIILLANHFRSSLVDRPERSLELLSNYTVDHNEQNLNEYDRSLLVNYYYCYLITYIGLNDENNADRIYSECADLFAGIDTNDPLYVLVQGVEFNYYLHKNQLDRAQTILDNMVTKNRFIADGAKAEILAKKGQYEDARKIYHQLSKRTKKIGMKQAIEIELKRIDMLENGEIRHIHDCIPQIMKPDQIDREHVKETPQE